MVLAGLHRPDGDRRLVKHGYDPGTLKHVLRERYNREHADQIVRYMQTYRKAVG